MFEFAFMGIIPMSLLINKNQHFSKEAGGSL